MVLSFARPKLGETWLSVFVVQASVESKLQPQTICHKSFLNGALGLSKLTEKYLASADGSVYIQDKTVLDIGSGKGNLVGRVLDNNARKVLGIDISGDAVKNCQNKFAGDKRVEFAKIDLNNRTAMSKFIQQAAPAGVDTFLCNPAQVPLAAPLANGYFAGNDGRRMVDAVLREFAAVGLPRAVLIMTQTQLSGWKKTMEWCKSHGLCATVVASSSFPMYADIQTNDDAMTYLHKRFGFGKKSSLEGHLLLIRHAATCPPEVDQLGERKDESDS